MRSCRMGRGKELQQQDLSFGEKILQHRARQTEGGLLAFRLELFVFLEVLLPRWGLEAGLQCLSIGRGLRFRIQKETVLRRVSFNL